MRYID